MIRIMKFGEIPDSEIFARDEKGADVSGIVSGIIADVRSRGDAALFDYCSRFDKAELSCLAVTEKELDEAFAAVEPKFLEILEKAARNICSFHEIDTFLIVKEFKNHLLRFFITKFK